MFETLLNMSRFHRLPALGLVIHLFGHKLVSGPSDPAGWRVEKQKEGMCVFVVKMTEKRTNPPFGGISNVDCFSRMTHCNYT